MLLFYFHKKKEACFFNFLGNSKSIIDTCHKYLLFTYYYLTPLKYDKYDFKYINIVNKCKSWDTQVIKNKTDKHKLTILRFKRTCIHKQDKKCKQVHD